MKKFARILSVALVAALLTAIMAGCVNNGGDSGASTMPPAPSASPATTEPEGPARTDKLVVYTPNSDDLLNATIPLFEKMYGVKVEIIQGGAGELLARIDAEKASPYGDIIYGGGESIFTQYRDCLEDYVSPNDAEVNEKFRNVSGFCTNYVIEAPVIIYNTDLIGDIEIKGYADLLNPELKGKIAAADPTASSSALFQVENMLAAFGGFESDKGWKDSWDYISKLIANMDGKVASGSSAVWKSVTDGEMIVGLTFEEAAFNLVRDGAPVQIVYPKEGTFFSPTPVAVIKNGPNNANAKLFVDFLISREGQEAIAAMGSSRPVRDDVQLHEAITPNSEIYSVAVDEAYMYTIIDTIKETYQDLFADLFPG